MAGRCQRERDESHPRRGQAAQAASPPGAEIALAVEHQAVGGLIVQEIAEGLPLQVKEKGPVAQGRGRRRSEDQWRSRTMRAKSADRDSHAAARTDGPSG